METAASRLSSYWRSTRVRLALSGLVLAVLVVASVVVFLQNRDDDTDRRRDAVKAYIGEINKTQQVLIGELDQVGRSYRELRLSGEGDAKELARLQESERTLRTLRSRLAALPAPPEALKLRSELLQLARLQVELAGEVVGMSRYIPAQAEQARAVITATVTLRTRLGEAKTGAQQKTALEAYRTVLRRAVERLEATPAPRVLDPVRTRELARLAKLADLARRLGAALAAQRTAEIDQLFRDFLVANASTGTTRAERDAVVAYNRRVAAIAKQQKAVSVERARLDRVLR